MFSANDQAFFNRSIPRVGGFAVPLHRFVVILGTSDSLLVTGSQMPHRGRIVYPAGAGFKPVSIEQGPLAGKLLGCDHLRDFHRYHCFLTRSPVQNLFNAIGDELNALANSVFDCLCKPEAIRQARQLASKFSLASSDIFDSVDLSNPVVLKRVSLLSLSSDCIRWVKHALQVHGQIDPNKLPIAYTLIGPIAGYYATIFDKYSCYKDISQSDILSFLNDFFQDKGWFGGDPKGGSPFLGSRFICIVSIIEGDLSLIDTYEHIMCSILLGIIGGNGISRHESRMLGLAHELQYSMRECVNTSLQPMGPQIPTPEKPTTDGVGIASKGVAPRTSSPVAKSSELSPDEALRQATCELESLIGLSGVKDEVKRLISFLKVQQERRRQGLRESSQALHFVFTGNPGTGKTTVARILGKIFFGFGILKTPKMVECDRSALVGGFLGQTAIKTDEVIMSALNGVLFIDEAYCLAGDSAKYGHGDMYGEEAINTLLKRMEDLRDQLIVIAAGYPTPMKAFLHSNPGLESRFTRFIEFEDYTVPDLCRIFEKYCRDSEYSLSPSACANAMLLFSVAHTKRDERFGNARFVRNVFEQVVSQHSDRLATSDTFDRDALVLIDGRDIPTKLVPGIDSQSVDLTACRWEALCPGCGKSTEADLGVLGQRIKCECGQPFFFPWWNLIPQSMKGLPAEYFPSSQQGDKMGIAAPSLSPQSSPSFPPQTAQTTSSQAGVRSWRADPERGQFLLREGEQFLKQQDGRKAFRRFEVAIRVDWPNSDPGKRPYYQYRAQAYLLLGQERPSKSMAEYNAATTYRDLGRFRLATGGYIRSLELDPDFLWAWNNLAWLQATHSDDRARDGTSAVRHALVACEKSDWHCWSFIDTLSAAYAEAGDFGLAVTTAEKALVVAPHEKHPEIEGNIQKFLAQQPLREPSHPLGE